MVVVRNRRRAVLVAGLSSADPYGGVDRQTLINDKL